MVEVLGGQVDAGRRLLWISVWTKDYPIVECLRERVGVDSGPIVDARSDPHVAMKAIGRCEVFLGEKLHAAAIAALARTPFIAFEYQPKVRDFTEFIGMGYWTLSTEIRNPETICAMMDELREERDGVAAALEAQTAKARTHLLRCASKARQLALRAAAA